MRPTALVIAPIALALGLSARHLAPDAAPDSTTAPLPSGFSSTTIDLGVVVSDLETSAAFYTDVIGFEELDGFSVPGELCAQAGLTSEPLTIRVFALGDGEHATKVKLMQIPGVETRTGDNEFIHSHTGFRYLTLYVEDTNAALERLAAADVEPLATGPVCLGEDPMASPYLTVVRDPDGNMIELIGPKE